MEVNMILLVLGLLFVLLITRVITLETFKMNLATLSLIIIMVALLFSSLSIQYITSNMDTSQNPTRTAAKISSVAATPSMPQVMGPQANLKLF